MTPISAGETILQAISYILDTYPANYDKIGELEKQQCDLLHQIEFEPIVPPRGYKMLRELKEMRLERRKLKDENELLKPLYDYLNTGNAQNFTVGMVNNLGKAKRRNEQLGNREYSPRSEAFKQVGADCEEERQGGVNEF